MQVLKKTIKKKYIYLFYQRLRSLKKETEMKVHLGLLFYEYSLNMSAL